MRIINALKLKSGLNIIVLYDGVCNICNSSIQFAMKRNSKPPIVRYASLQSKIDYSTDEVIDAELSLLPQPELFMKSDASLELVKYLDYPWPITYIFKIFPKSFRDGIYDWWARNRYQNFGKTDSCQAPMSGWEERILDWKEFQSSE
ncbi:thiol-disulfide oxidoreductase DCC family protein [Rhizophagus clarus]|uniref:Thiol-disulfide oxidoreductase DCC family protein n=1 Tax=Rhizophagus clarus TaxID=94130 RepID=A0A8H3M298_9GLOM|nr:thiol-disulfide oxidoreductase DCC family protein [Rhizophagus clarus]